VEVLLAEMGVTAVHRVLVAVVAGVPLSLYPAKAATVALAA
jgi:hypothetical protein